MPIAGVRLRPSQASLSGQDSKGVALSVTNQLAKGGIRVTQPNCPATVAERTALQPMGQPLQNWVV
jgi:hypothetical protein